MELSKRSNLISNFNFLAVCHHVNALIKLIKSMQHSVQESSENRSRQIRQDMAFQILMVQRVDNVPNTRASIIATQLAMTNQLKHLWCDCRTKEQLSTFNLKICIFVLNIMGLILQRFFGPSSISKRHYGLI